jgi:hypothetical protein
MVKILSYYKPNHAQIKLNRAIEKYSYYLFSNSSLFKSYLPYEVVSISLRQIL